MLQITAEIAKANEPSTPTSTGPGEGPAGGTSTASVLATPQKKMKMSTVANQADDIEIETLSDVKVNKFYKNYTDIFDSLPPADEEPKQLTAVWALIHSGAPPYVDLPSSVHMAIV